VLDTSLAGLATDNRWNAAGERTFYLAGDLGVALAEYARHLQLDVGLAPSSLLERAVYQVHVDLSGILDLRDTRVRSAIGLHGGLSQFLDRDVARASALFLRRTTSAEGLLVPSVAFLDDAERWNLVIFLEKLPPDVSTFMTAKYLRTVRAEP
jgi:RES domain-containing protein